ncbi:response regulator transcription factor [Desulfurivibrio sp. D14AmB]|uniref:response regulator transcription factor n=1 Tax=Desulfurivibrio sp. D14AmB TaxID=3374370 RepID=UPI00376EE484
MSDRQQKILLVDDEATFRRRLEKAFARRGLTVFGAGDYDTAIAIIHGEKPDLAVIDLRMPGRSGLELVAAARRIHPDLAMVVLTGYGSIATATVAIRLGAVAYLPKPADADEILLAFRGQPAPELEVDQETDGDESGSKKTKTTKAKFPAPSLARAEWEHINRVLADCDGNISQAAQRLGLHRRTLQRKLQKMPPRR